MGTLEKIVKAFLSSYFKKAPFLLGLSGGPDSMALFYLLLQEKALFEVAHVNHRWREESDHEEEILRKLVEKNGIVFHSTRLNPNMMEGNLEDVCRQMRKAFFKQIIDERGLAGVILAHQRDDVAEIILKRIFEGASTSIPSPFFIKRF